jgi:Glycogen recognition site of AMP-activated protein kinase
MLRGLLLLALFFPVCYYAKDSNAQQEPSRKVKPETLKKYEGRYELESGVIPISTLDVTLENDELWVKPSLLKKRRLLYKSKAVFVDEMAGTLYTFNKDDEARIASLTFQYEGADYTALKVVLPPPSLKGNTTFRLPGHTKAKIVILSGSFNNWNQSQFVFGREGDQWVCRIDLEPGRHAYKFIVDGNWILDPANPNTEDDDYGVQNSVVIVTKSANDNP